MNLTVSHIIESVGFSSRYFSWQIRFTAISIHIRYLPSSPWMANRDENQGGIRHLSYYCMISDRQWLPEEGN